MADTIYVSPSHRPGFFNVMGDTWPLNHILRRTPGLKWDAMRSCVTGRGDSVEAYLAEATRLGFPIQGSCAPPLTHQIQIADMHPDQALTVEWAARSGLEGCIIGHPMGAGKSWIAIEAASRLGPQRKLVVCPAFLRTNWQVEIEKRKPATTIGFSLQDGAEWTIVSYEYMKKHVDSLMNQYGALIFDEVHRVKNSDSKCYQAARRLRDRVGWTATLTGTPIWNRLIDLWGLADVTRPEVFGNRYHFAKSYSIYTPAGTWDGPYPEDPDFERIITEIKGRLKWFYRRQDDLAQKLCGTGAVRTVMQWLPRPPGYVEPLIKSAFALSAALQHVSRFKVGAAVESAKLLRDGGTTFLIFTFLREAARDIAKDLGVPVAEGGGVDAASLSNLMAQAGGGIATMDSFGMGANCAWADQVIFAGMDWTHSKMLQALMRAQRPGRRCPLVGTILGCRGTVDEAVAATLVSKLNQSSAVIDDSVATAMRDGMRITQTDDEILTAMMERLSHDK